MSNDQPSAPPQTFEEALSALEAVVHDLEEGRIGLADALGRYETGVQLLRQCYAHLERAEQKIELLSGVDDSGAARTEPFDEGDLPLEEKARQRSRRRSGGPGAEA